MYSRACGKAGKPAKKATSPVCEYEWQPGICAKPEKKGTNRKYVPLGHEVLRAHLEGQLAFCNLPNVTIFSLAFPLLGDYFRGVWCWTRQNHAIVFKRIFPPCSCRKPAVVAL
jgi:hypothetical protein